MTARFRRRRRDGARARARPRAAGHHARRRARYAAAARGAMRESPLGNLFADAQRERTGADVAINNNVRGGLRADLAAGRAHVRPPVRRVPVRQPARDRDAHGSGARRRRRRTRCAATAQARSRSRARACTRRCTAGGALEVELRARLGRADRRRTSALVVAAMDSLVAGAVFAPARPPAGFGVPPQDAPVMREVVEDWLRERGGRLDVEPIRGSQSAALERRGSGGLPRGVGCARRVLRSRAIHHSELES